MRLGFVLRMAIREARSSRGRMALLALCVACGVGALVTTDSITGELGRRIREESRGLLGGDCEVHSRRAPSPRLQAAAATLEREGVRIARTVETLSMVATPGSTSSRLVELKAVSPEYPLFGALQVEPPAALDRFRRGEGVLVSRALLAQLGTGPATVLTIGRIDLPVIGLITNEPDRVGEGLRVGPRLMLRLADLDRTGLIGWGSRVVYRLLLRLAPGVTPASVRERLLDRRGEPWVEFRSAALHEPPAPGREGGAGQPGLDRFLTRSGIFLDLVGATVLLLAGLGIGVAILTLVRERLDTMAVLKCLGATSVELVAMHVLLALAVGACGSLAGLAVARAVLWTVPPALAGVLPFAVEFGLDAATTARGLGLGTLVSALFALVPVLALRTVPPSRVLSRLGERGPHVPDRLTWFAALAVTGCSLALVAARARSPFVASRFVASLAAALLALLAGSRILLWAARRLTTGRSFTARQAFANLYRPGNQTGSVLVSVGLAVFLVQTIQLTDRGLRREFVEGMPETAPNLFVVDIQDDQRAPVEAILASHGARAVQVASLYRARIRAVDGRSVDELHPDPARAPWWITREYMVTQRERVADTERVVEGRFWQAGERPAEVSVERSTCERLGVGLGGRLTFESQGRVIEARVGSIREVRWSSLRPNFFLVFPPHLLEGLPRTHFAVAHLAGETARAALQRELVRRHPNLMVIDVAVGLSMVASVLDRLAWVLELAALACLVGGLAVLVLSVTMTRRHRLLECAILKAQGATRPALVAILAVEYVLLGLVGGAVGAASAGLGTRVLAHAVFDVSLSWDWPAFAAATLSAAAATALAGALASRGLLARPPLEIMREA